MKVESAVVDSGASTSVFGVNIEQDMLEKQASTRTFSGFASGVTRMASRDGHVTVLVLGEDGRSGGSKNKDKSHGSRVTHNFVDISVTTLDGLAENLLSVGQMVERQGYKFIAAPSSSGEFTGFFKVDGAGRMCDRMPVHYDERRGLYFVYYIVGRSKADIMNKVKSAEANGASIISMLKSRKQSSCFVAATLTGDVDEGSMSARCSTLHTRSYSSGDGVDWLDETIESA